MTKIIFATGNEGKMREIRDIMADLDVELLSMKEAGIKLDIVEDGKTFEENALIKAGAVAKEAPGAIVILADKTRRINSRLFVQMIPDWKWIICTKSREFILRVLSARIYLMILKIRQF